MLTWFRTGTWLIQMLSSDMKQTCKHADLIHNRYMTDTDQTSMKRKMLPSDMKQTCSYADLIQNRYITDTDHITFWIRERLHFESDPLPQCSVAHCFYWSVWECKQIWIRTVPVLIQNVRFCCVHSSYVLVTRQSVLFKRDVIEKKVLAKVAS